LQKHYDIDTEDFLAYVHDLPLGDYLTPIPFNARDRVFAGPQLISPTRMFPTPEEC